MDGEWFFYFFMATAILAGLTVLQFYKGRKINLAILEQSIRILEDVFKPKDKNYTVIGIYVGYSALYKIYKDLINTVEAVVTLLPRQSLLYYPISRLTSRFDKIYLVIHYDRDKILLGEAHVVKKGYYRLGIRRTIRGIEKMNIETINIANKTYYLVYTHRNLVEKLLNFVQSLSNPTLVNHVAVVPQYRRLYLTAKLNLENLSELVAKFYELGKKL